MTATISDIQTILANILGTDMSIAGLAIFAIIAAVVFVLARRIWASMIILMPVVLIFSSMGILTNDMTILLIIVLVLGLAATARTAAGGK